MTRAICISTVPNKVQQRDKKLNLRPQTISILKCLKLICRLTQFGPRQALKLN
jgi:hypothetical protein